MLSFSPALEGSNPRDHRLWRAVSPHSGGYGAPYPSRPAALVGRVPQVQRPWQAVPLKCSPLGRGSPRRPRLSRAAPLQSRGFHARYPPRSGAAAGCTHPQQRGCQAVPLHPPSAHHPHALNRQSAQHMRFASKPTRTPTSLAIHSPPLLHQPRTARSKHPTMSMAKSHSAKARSPTLWTGAPGCAHSQPKHILVRNISRFINNPLHTIHPDFSPP
jgi:hypothetical protein